MIVIIPIVIVVISLLVALVNLRRATTFFLISILLAPYISLLGVSIRIELILVPLFFVLMLIKRRQMFFPRLIFGLVVFLFCLLFATAISVFTLVDGDLLLTPIVGLSRLIAVCLIFANMGYSQKDAVHLIRYFVYLALPLGLLGIGQALDNNWLTAVTIQAYSSVNRSSLSSQLEEAGWLSRSVSVFESPAFSATYFLLALGIGVWLILNYYSMYSLRVRALLILSICCAFICGLLTLSATFVAGVVILFLWLLIRLRWRQKIHLFFLTVVSFSFLSPVVLFVLAFSPVASGSLLYQWSRLSSFEVFETRLNAQDGLLAGTVLAVQERPLFGWGFIGQENIFLGDSLYILWMYFGGLIGWLIFSLVILAIVRLCLQVEEFGEPILLVLVLLLAVGLGAPSFSIPRLADWWWALVGILLWGNRSWRLS